MVRSLLTLLLVLLASSVAYAAALMAVSGDISQLGGGEAPVSRYHVRVLSASITVNISDQITGGSVTVSSTVPGTYVVTITVSSGAASRTYTTTVYLSSTPTTISFTVTPLPYTALGATITVRAEPA